MSVTFRDRLLATLRAIRPVLEVPGIMVVGSEVPNLLQPDSASTLVVSQDVDLAVPIAGHEEVKQRLRVVEALIRSEDEPSVWIDPAGRLLEVNFVGRDPAIREAEETYVLEDRELPLLVFGQLSLMVPGPPLVVEDLVVPLPRLAGLVLEKLLTDRSGEKGERDLLVALALLMVGTDGDVEELGSLYGALRADLRHAVRSNMTVLSLLAPRPGMPDPRAQRQRVSDVLSRLERQDAQAT